jgi:hypothetical protein
MPFLPGTRGQARNSEQRRNTHPLEGYSASNATGPLLPKPLLSQDVPPSTPTPDFVHKIGEGLREYSRLMSVQSR